MTDRRAFLRQAGVWSAMMAMGRQAQAQSVGDYKALVCVFLYGGNDAFNTVLATDAASWNAYSAVRNQQPNSLALLAPGTAADPTKAIGSPEWLGGVLPLSPVQGISGRSFAFHPAMRNMADMFNKSRRLAVVSNIGPLVQPLIKDEYASLLSGASATKKIPKKLFSHNDQQNTWQAFAPEGASAGWGGMLVDGYYAGTPNTYASVSVGGNAVWLSGKKAHQYQITTNGAIAMGGNTVYGSEKVANTLRRVASNGMAGVGATGVARVHHALMADLGAISERSIKAEAGLTSAFAAVPTSDTRVGPNSKLQYQSIYGTTPVNSLAAQLQAVARVIASRASLGPGRQVFFVQMGGFDTHDNQNANHAELLTRLDHALAYFDKTLNFLEVQNQVTTFTASDFGRTFTSNGDGTDHGWGGHQFVMGGAVAGGKIYGNFPILGLKNSQNNQFDSSDDMLGNGVLLPTTSVDQLGATLAAWFVPNLSASALKATFPNLANFNTKNLGFMV